MFEGGSLPSTNLHQLVSSLLSWHSYHNQLYCIDWFSSGDSARCWLHLVVL